MSFNPEGSDNYFGDPFLNRVVLGWLSQYANLRMIDPSVASRLESQGTAMEMVPMPRALIDRLRTHSSDVTVAEDVWNAVQRGGVHQAAGALDFVSTVEARRHYPEIAAVMRAFSTALEKGDVASAMGRVAEDYVDMQGRDKSMLQSALSEAHAALGGLKLIVGDPNNVQLMGNKIYAQVEGSWAGKPANSGPFPSGAFKADVLFERTDGGAWQIMSIRS